MEPINANRSACESRVMVPSSVSRKVDPAACGGPLRKLLFSSKNPERILIHDTRPPIRVRSIPARYRRTSPLRGREAHPIDAKSVGCPGGVGREQGRTRSAGAVALEGLVGHRRRRGNINVTYFSVAKGAGRAVHRNHSETRLSIRGSGRGASGARTISSGGTAFREPQWNQEVRLIQRRPDRRDDHAAGPAQSSAVGRDRANLVDDLQVD